MRRAIWMALAFMGTAPLVALAQQNAGGQGAGSTLAPPAASPSGAASVQRGQDTAGTDVPGAPGQQSAGSLGTATGEPATGGSGTAGTGTQGGSVTQSTGNPVGLDSVPLQRTGPQGEQGLSGGGAGTGGGGMAGSGPTYQGTSQEEPPSATPPLNVGTQVGPEPNERAGSAGTGTVSAGGAGGAGTGTGARGTGGTGSGGTGGAGSSVGGGASTGGTSGAGVGGGGSGGSGGGQAAQAPLPKDPEAMRREILNLRQRVARLESEVDALRGTGGGGSAGTGGSGTTGTTDTSNVQVQGPVTLAITTFDGRVVDVTRQHIDIVDTSDGSFYRLSLNEQTKAFVGPRLNRIPVQRLSEGMPVRTSFAFISTGEQQALNIVAQPLRPRQEQQQRQQQQRERMGPGQRMAVPPRPSR
jgi:hypothetical protein